METPIEPVELIPASTPSSTPVTPIAPASTQIVAPTDAEVSGAEPVVDPAAPTETSEEAPVEEALAEEDSIWGESTLPKEQVTKLREVFGDQALEVVADFEALSELKTSFGGIPTSAEISQLLEGSQAIGELYKHLDTDPQRAVAFFLTGEGGNLDANGQKFVTALADGVRLGSVPVPVRNAFANSVASALLANITQEIVDFEAEIGFAQSRGMEAKVEGLQLNLGERMIIQKYLQRFAGSSGAPEGSQNQNQAAANSRNNEFAQRKAELDAREQRMNEGVQRETATHINTQLQSTFDGVVKHYLDRIPASTPKGIREAVIASGRVKFEEEFAKNAQGLRAFFDSDYQQAILQANTPQGAALRNRAVARYKAMTTTTAAKVYTPILNEMGITLSTTSQQNAANQANGAAKLNLPVTGVQSGTQTGGPVGASWDKAKETASQYMDRMLKQAGM